MTTPRTAWAMALITAATANIEGMKAKNAEREAQGYAQAYDDTAFFAEAQRMEELAREVINQ